MATNITVGVLALQGAFSEHMQLLRQAFQTLDSVAEEKVLWQSREVRTRSDLDQCDALIIPGGESTAISLVAARSGLLEPLRSFVKVERKPTWGTCAGLILLAEAANRTKKGGQELIGGLDVRVNRNHFGRQFESFEADLDLPFLDSKVANGVNVPFRATFIRSPIVEKILPKKPGIQEEEDVRPDTIVAPSRKTDSSAAQAQVEVLGTFRAPTAGKFQALETDQTRSGVIVAVKQGNVFGTSFHPELTGDARIHIWWLEQLRDVIMQENGRNRC